MTWTIVNEMNEMNCGLKEMRCNMINDTVKVTCHDRFPHLKPHDPLIT